MNKTKILIFSLLSVLAISATTFSSLTIGNNGIKALASRESEAQAHTFTITNFQSGTPWTGGYTYYAYEYFSEFSTTLGNPLSFMYRTDTGGEKPTTTAVLYDDDYSIGIAAKCENGELTNCFRQITAITVTFTGKVKLGVYAYTLNQERTAATFDYYYFDSKSVRAELTSDVRFSLDGLEQYNQEGLIPNGFRLYTPSSATITKFVIEYIC